VVSPSDLLASALFNRFYRIELPAYLGFFSGKRSVPIITAGAALFFGAILSICWLSDRRGIADFSVWSASGNPVEAFALYGLVERLLIPFGLHHIWNVPFQMVSGQYLDPNTADRHWRNRALRRRRSHRWKFGGRIFI